MTEKELVELEEGLSNCFEFLSRKTDTSNLKEFRISELCHCPRKSVYLRQLGEQQKVNGRMLSGSMFHEFIPEMVKYVKAFEGAEFEKTATFQTGDFVIVGHADAVVGDILYEFKYSGCRRNVPGYFHRQANAYAVVLGCKEYRIVIVNPYDLAVQILTGKADQTYFDEMIHSANEIFQCLNFKEDMPLGPLEDRECKYCPYSEKCRTENEFFPEEVK